MWHIWNGSSDRSHAQVRGVEFKPGPQQVLAGSPSKGGRVGALVAGKACKAPPRLFDSVAREAAFNSSLSAEGGQGWPCLPALGLVASGHPPGGLTGPPRGD